jgi:carbamoyl-phosphate synthase large subunit
MRDPSTPTAALPPLTVLITGIGSAGVYGVIKCLRANGERPIRILGVDLDPQVASRAFVDAFYPAPPRTDAAYLPFILELLEREQVDILWPIPTAELELFSLVKPEWEALGHKVLISDLDGLAIANNKKKLYQFMAGQNHPAQMRFEVIQDLAQFDAALSTMGYPDRPVCVRKAFSTGAQGFRILDPSVDQLDLFLNKNPNATHTTHAHLRSILATADPFPELLVQEYLPGDEYDVDVLCHQGRSLAILPRLNYRMIWGASSLCETLPHAQIRQYSEEIIQSLNLSYVINLSFKLDAAGQPKLIEINPRVPSSIAITMAAGVNCPYLSLKVALGESVTVPPIQWNTQMIRYWDEVYLDAAGQFQAFPLTPVPTATGLPPLTTEVSRA